MPEYERYAEHDGAIAHMNQISAPRNLPPKPYLLKIEKMSEQITDPVRKLRFLNKALADYYRVNGHGPVVENLPKTVLSQSAVGQDARFENQADFVRKDDVQRRFFRTTLWLGVVLMLICGIGGLVILSKNFIQSKNTQPIQADAEKDIYHRIEPPVQPRIETPKLPEVEPRPVTTTAASPAVPKPAKRVPEYLDTTIWMVEKTADSEFYSNGLRIFTNQVTENIPRAYYRIPISKTKGPEIDARTFTSAVAGIVFHASESDVYEFRPEMTRNIREYSRLLMRYIRRKKAYHYFIDRFGQVYRLVREDHAAFHAGNSVWMDSDAVYIDLNHAFVGICFEGRDFINVDPATVKGEGNGIVPHIMPMNKSSINETQLQSGKELTDWLRVKYGIPQRNCVPHCLVSVNPYDMLIGHHLDLSHGFPFEFFGLSDKYKESIPAITEFGFTYNNYFMEILKAKIWPGISVSENQLQCRAKAEQMSVDGYRNRLRTKYKQIFKEYKLLKQSMAKAEEITAHQPKPAIIENGAATE